MKTDKVLIFAAMIGLLSIGLMVIPQSSAFEMQGDLQSTDVDVNKTTMLIRGSATDTAIPDTIIFTIVVETCDKQTMAGSQDKNAEIVEAIKTTLLENGIQEDEIQTTYYWVSTKTEYKDKRYVFAGYVTRHDLTVKTDKLENIGKIFDGITEDGASNIRNIRWCLKEETKQKLERELLAQALENAKKKVEYTFPSATNVKILDVTETSALGSLVYRSGYTFGAAGYDYEEFSSTTEISEGSIALTSAVTATFEVSG